MVQTVAIFDLDSTLLDGDSEVAWRDYMTQKGLVDDEFLTTIDSYIEEYKAGFLDYAKFERSLLSPLRGLPADEVAFMREDYLMQVRRLFRPFMLKRLEEHRQQGDQLLLATASNSFLADPIAAMLDISNLVCTRVGMENGVPTGEIIGQAAYQQGKVEKIKNWMQDTGNSFDGSWGYSDSLNDLPILNLVEHPVAVLPDDTLRQYALGQGWEIIDILN